MQKNRFFGKGFTGLCALGLITSLTRLVFMLRCWIGLG